MKPKAHYQQRVAALLGYSTKIVGLVHNNWHHQQEIHVVMPPANRLPKRQWIPKSNEVLFAVRTLVREKQAKNERIVACHILDLTRQYKWLVVDESDPKAYAYDTSYCSSVRVRGLLHFNTVIVVSKELICKELGSHWKYT